MATFEAAVEPHRFVFRRPWAAAIDRAIGAVVNPLAAILVVAEVVILASGVFTRYVLRSPLVWSDELATILFLWLAMLGSVVVGGQIEQGYGVDGPPRPVRQVTGHQPQHREPRASRHGRAQQIVNPTAKLIENGRVADGHRARRIGCPGEKAAEEHLG